MSTAPMTALELGLLSCHACALVSRPVAQGQSRCPRCGAVVHPRKPGAIARTWALIIAAAILYVPANVLPIMETRSLFGAQSDTILSGVAFLWSTGSWMLALIVFVASVMVPLLKLLALAVLAISVQRRAIGAAGQRAALYRVIEFVGRWSMLDIYVVTVLVALVQASTLASVRAGPAAAAFGAVVVLTMFAARAFDPRLIWDPVKVERG